MSRLIFGPENIDGIWTIDVVDLDGESYSFTYQSRADAERAWELMRNDGVDAAHREEDK